MNPITMVFGEGTRSGNRAWLIKRLAWRLQALAEGDCQNERDSADGVGSRCRSAHHGAPSTRDAATDASIQPAGRRSGSPLAATGNGHHPPVQGRASGSIGLARWLQLRGNPLCHAERGRQDHHRRPLQRLPVLPADRERRCPVKSSTIPPQVKKIVARSHPQIHRRGVGQGVQHARRPARIGRSVCPQSGRRGWVCLADRYDDGGFTGGNMDRPALRRLLADIQAGKVNCVLVYKVDRLSRSLLDFARIMELFDRHRVAFVSVTQQFNTASSMGHLVLNVLLSFAQFEREIISERGADKIAAARRKGKWAGGHPILGYDIDVRGFKLVVNSAEARRVRTIFELYPDGR